MSEDFHSNIEQETAGEIHSRQLRAEDIVSLRIVIEQWVLDPQTDEVITEEVEDILANMERSTSDQANDRQYIVAESNGEIVGVMGVAMPSELMQQFAATDHPVEIINAFVSANTRGSGAGTQLLSAVEATARFIGATEIMVNSGPRYQDTAWGFYDKRFGGRVTTLRDHYGPGLDAPVWSKRLV